MPPSRQRPVEWITLGLVFACYAAWGAGVYLLPSVWLPLAMVVTALSVTLQSSLQHEMIHGHPFRSRRLNAALVFPSLSLCIPYGRFRDTHIAHHIDPNLTDPYDDPESNYMDPKVWRRLPGWAKSVLRFNNTLAGRLLIGPVVGHIFWLKGDWAAIRAGDRAVRDAWLWHIPAMALVIWAVALSPMPFWAYLLSAYAALSTLKIRTYLEHRAHEQVAGRTVVIEDKGLLAFLFLNNNLHAVHHRHPSAPWYALPAMFRAESERYLRENDSYRYTSYREVFGRYLTRAKDQVPHPLWPN